MNVRVGSEARQDDKSPEYFRKKWVEMSRKIAKAGKAKRRKDPPILIVGS